MILTAHQPVYLPWLGLFHKIALADRFISFDQVQYLPKDWNNRNRIKTPNGPIWLTVPVHRKGHRDKRICEIEINNALPWGRKHLKSLVVNYAKAPYFDRYIGFFEKVYTSEWRYLVDLNSYMLSWFLHILGLELPVDSAGHYDFEGSKGDLVLDMCLKLGAEKYIFGVQGKNYADIKSFEAAGVHPVFQEYNHPEYPQLHGDFISNLSIVDLLFNCGEESLKVILSGNAESVERL